MKKGKLTAAQRKALTAALRAMGSLGGKASAAVLTPAERSAKARKAGLARAAKARKKTGGKR